MLSVIEDRIKNPENEKESNLVKAAQDYKVSQAKITDSAQSNMGDLKAANEFLNTIRELDAQYIALAREQMIRDD